MNKNAIASTFINPTISVNKISQKPVKQISSYITPFNYSKYCYQHSDISDSEEEITEIDAENCPLEDILNRRFIQ